MSTIKVSNIRIASESVSRPVTGVAASWVNLDGTGTISIRDSLNVSSLSDVTTGRYEIYLTSDMSSSEDYSVTVTKQDTTVNTDSTFFDTIATRTASSYRVVSIEAGVNTDTPNMNAVQMGELA